MQASEEEKVTNGLIVVLGTATLALMHATHNPTIVLQIVNIAIDMVLEGKEENAPTPKDKGGN